jgi:hypothetical protein
MIREHVRRGADGVGVMNASIEKIMKVLGGSGSMRQAHLVCFKLRNVLLSIEATVNGSQRLVHENMPCSVGTVHQITQSMIVIFHKQQPPQPKQLLTAAQRLMLGPAAAQTTDWCDSHVVQQSGKQHRGWQQPEKLSRGWYCH